jgi:TonB family protein
VIAVDDFEPFDEPPARLRSDPERVVVGLYRGGSGPELRLTEVDASRIEKLFKRPELIYLLVIPQAGAPARAAIFIQERGQIQGFKPYREFPFHAALLKSGEFPTSDRGVIRKRRGATVLSLAAITLTGAALVPLTDRDGQAVAPVQALLPAPPPPTAQPVAPSATNPITVLDNTARRSKPSPAVSSRRLSKDEEDETPVREADRQKPQPPPAVAPQPADVPAPPALSAAEPADVLPRTPPARRAAAVAVSLEPVPPNAMRRFVQKIPGLRALQKRRYKAGDEFAPARPLRNGVGAVPDAVAASLRREVPIHLRLRVDERGRVSEIEIVETSGQAELTDIAASSAERWRFEPARLNQKPVESELIARFRFRPVP